MNHIRAAFTINGTTSKSLEQAIMIGFFIAVGVFWLVSPSKILPTPWGVIGAFPDLWFKDGIGIELWTSLTLNIEAIVIMSTISLLVSYATAIPAMRPFASTISIARFNGFVGLPLLFTIWIGDQHWIKVALLVTGMCVFTVPSIVTMIEAIPRDAYDHGRVLRMSRARVLWEVVILGRFHEVIDILRTNVAIGWMMLPMVEGLFRAEGGIGVLILTENKYFKLESVYAIIFLVAGIGLAQDFMIRLFKSLMCPYANINTERK